MIIDKLWATFSDDLSPDMSPRMKIIIRAMFLQGAHQVAGVIKMTPKDSRDPVMDVILRECEEEIKKLSETAS